MRKWFVYLSVFYVVLPIIFGLSWYTVVFFPNFKNIMQLAKDGQMQAKPIQESLYKLAVIEESKDGLWVRAINNAYCTQIDSGSREDCHSVNFNNIVWAFVGSIHMNDSDEFGLWVKCTVNDCENGLAKASKLVFGKPMNELTLREQAELIISVSSQTRFKPGTPQFEKRVDEMMDEM